MKVVFVFSKSVVKECGGGQIVKNKVYSLPTQNTDQTMIEISLILVVKEYIPNLWNQMQRRTTKHQAEF